MKIGSADISKLYLGSAEIDKAYLGTEMVYSKSDLPSGYTELAYLQSNGSQYINTSFIPNGDEVFSLSCMLVTSSTGSAYVNMFGCRDGAVGTSKKNCWLGLSSGQAVFNRFGTINPTASVSMSTNINYDIIVNLPQTNTQINNNQLTFSGSVVEGVAIPISIFKIGGTNLASGGTFRIYGLTIERNGIIVRNYMPAKRDSDGGVGFFDTIAEGFLTNAGTGDFTYELK